MQVEFRIESARGTRGPARISGAIAATAMAAAAGVIPKQGWAEVRAMGPLRRGPVGAKDWVLESGDPLGLFRHRGPSFDSELALVLPRFKSLAERTQTRELEASPAAPRSWSCSETYCLQ